MPTNQATGDGWYCALCSTWHIAHCPRAYQPQYYGQPVTVYNYVDDARLARIEDMLKRILELLEAQDEQS